MMLMFLMNALPTDQPTDQPTDTAYYRDARTHLKTRPIGQRCVLSAFCVMSFPIVVVAAVVVALAVVVVVVSYPPG